ncbi:RNA polymerase sigma factor [Bremerella volcania]|uniref:RNA polymerase sigma factor n=1 Tax=Bremerella volcania TaxID=2527984 RepID=A0A518CCE2_9BACT|nr:sigma-70 family RNA polymerase sigma factor [Bremerella volcania]QDU76899.1 RNA polymerase sigma factor [Bremerella volcania]
MTDYFDTPDDLHPFAEALVKKLIAAKRPHGWDDHRTEDAIQELFLAGWQVLCETKDVGLAKNRMASRQYNLLRDFYSEGKREPKAVSRIDSDNQPGNIEGYATPRTSRCRDPAVDGLIRDYLGSLPERRREVCTLWMAGCTVDEIARETGIPKRTVQRELSIIKEGEQG